MPTIFRYPEDKTGVNQNNKVVDESHALPNRPLRVVVPQYGPIFTEGVVVVDTATNQPLTKGVDYVFAGVLEEPTARLGKEICELILIKNQSVSATVKITYQVLGGLYQNDASYLAQLYDAFLADNRPVDWVNILNKLTEYPPSLHLHMLSDMYGFEKINVMLERIVQAITLRNIPAYEALLDYINDQLGRQTAISIDGPLAVWQGVQAQWTITDFDSFSVYEVTASQGNISISGNTISYTMPNNQTINGQTVFTVKRNGVGRDFTVTVNTASLQKPTILSATPVPGTSNVVLSLVASAFTPVPNGADTHVSTSWFITTTTGLPLWESLSNTTSLTSILSSPLLATMNVLVRVKYTGALYESDWSDPFQVNTGPTTQNDVTIVSSLSNPAYTNLVANDVASTMDAVASSVCSPSANHTYSKTEWQIYSDESLAAQYLVTEQTTYNHHLIYGPMTYSGTYWIRVRESYTSTNHLGEDTGPWSDVIRLNIQADPGSGGGGGGGGNTVNPPTLSVNSTDLNNGTIAFTGTYSDNFGGSSDGMWGGIYADAGGNTLLFAINGVSSVTAHMVNIASWQNYVGSTLWIKVHNKATTGETSTDTLQSVTVGPWSAVNRDVVFNAGNYYMTAYDKDPIGTIISATFVMTLTSDLTWNGAHTEYLTDLTANTDGGGNYYTVVFPTGTLVPGDWKWHVKFYFDDGGPGQYEGNWSTEGFFTV